jgi:hypothetical protein
VRGVTSTQNDRIRHKSPQHFFTRVKTKLINTLNFCEIDQAFKLLTQPQIYHFACI